MPQDQLTTSDKQYVDGFNRQYESILDTIEKARQFNVGDYLILHISDYSGNMSLQKNSYGAPIKYKVVLTSKIGIPFIKRVNKNGAPIGRIYSCLGANGDDYREVNQRFEFSLDPDYADSIILQDSYDPASLHKSKKDIWKAVTAHNRANKVKTSTVKDLVNFYAVVKVGDMLWTSNKNHYLVQAKKQMTPKDWNAVAGWQYQASTRVSFITILTVMDKKGKVRDIEAGFFLDKALYKERPRTYKELNI